MYVLIHTHMHFHTLRLHTYAHACNTCVRVCIHIYMRTCTRICVHAHTCAYMRIHTRICILACARTCVHTSAVCSCRRAEGAASRQSFGESCWERNGLTLGEYFRFSLDMFHQYLLATSESEKHISSFSSPLLSDGNSPLTSIQVLRTSRRVD